MYTALIITKNIVPGVTERGRAFQQARVGNIQVDTLSNLSLETFSYQLTAKDIERATSRKLEDYDLVVVYVGARTPRLPVGNELLHGIEVGKLVFIMATEIPEEDYPYIMEDLGFTALMQGDSNMDAFNTFSAPVHDFNGVEAVKGIRAGLLETGHMPERPTKAAGRGA